MLTRTAMTLELESTRKLPLNAWGSLINSVTRHHHRLSPVRASIDAVSVESTNSIILHVDI